MRSVAINVAANTNEPGVRGPLFSDGSFEYVPIPEAEPTHTDATVPTYADLDLTTDVPEDYRSHPVHLDPEFAAYPGCDRYTYGDPNGVKAAPILDLAAGDYLLFYATLATDGDRPDWAPPEWGAFLIGQFRLARDPLTGEQYRELPADAEARAAFANNAHVKRDPFDARVLVHGDPDASGLYDTAVPLSDSSTGSQANAVVTALSADSGKGPWWRRPLRFEPDATDRVLTLDPADAARLSGR
ncbi:Nmad3 family putative nucleotide modification protein [Halorientalis regularis]|jgi:hypothetical protein|uniref:Nucleotide modification associated domain-containing protein n=1 Tax=Halorientalis regularis TaxID=660518 RepID=A0A1G7QNU8_9EURY|nr:hypothetical protein [Halorientalis regularis]SDG00211.1 hypothetical protein SAMN05216218_11333 [Halorientalis regularis]